MSEIKRYGVEGGKGTGGQHLPFARAAGADGWLFVSGQVPMVNGEIIDGGIVAQSYGWMMHEILCHLIGYLWNILARTRLRVLAWCRAWWWIVKLRWTAWPIKSRSIYKLVVNLCYLKIKRFMKKYLLFFICLLQPTWGLAQVALLPLMPYPQSIEQQAGQLLLNSNWKVNIEGKVSADVKNTLDIFVARASAQTGKKNRWEKVRYKKANLFVSVIDPTPISNYVKDWDEAYQLTINGDRIELHAQQLLGMQRGLETLLQLIGTAPEIRLPMLTIKDKPRFKWRGLLLDTSRHFFSVTTIKRQIDAMALAKYNIFHWHLTDDQGWRFESKKYPNLHKMASDGEFYTREQMADVVAYARARGIQVLPEIDMPGHASAIAVAYPELMSAPGPYTMEYHWGVHKPTLNPANENTYAFADAIVAEVAELFPFEYLHIGGDEVDPEHWNTNSSIQAFMKEHELKDHRALQAYFNQRLQIILQKHQRKMIGWDEIQHPDLPKDIVIHSWRGPDGWMEQARGWRWRGTGSVRCRTQCIRGISVCCRTVATLDRVPTRAAAGPAA
jgi:hypothetical protein